MCIERGSLQANFDQFNFSRGAIIKCCLNNNHNHRIIRNGFYKLDFNRLLLKVKVSSKSFNPIYPTPPPGQDMTQGQYLSGVLTGLNLEFSFS